MSEALSDFLSDQLRQLNRVVDAFSPLEYQISLLDTYQAARQNRQVYEVANDTPDDVVARYSDAIADLEAQRDVLLVALRAFSAEFAAWDFDKEEFTEIRTKNLLIGNPMYDGMTEQSDFTWEDLSRAYITYQAVHGKVGDAPPSPKRFTWLSHLPREEAYIVHPFLNLAHEAMLMARSELYSIHSQYGDQQSARDHSKALVLLEEAIETLEVEAL